MKLTIHSDVEQDLHQAAVFYEREGSPLLAARFVAEFKRVVGLIVAHPEIGSPRAKGRRGLTMKVFPFTVVYRLQADEIRILVVKHDRKRPSFGGTRA